MIKKRPVQTLIQSRFLARGAPQSCLASTGAPAGPWSPSPVVPVPSCAETWEDAGTSKWSLRILFYSVLVSLKILCCEKLQMDVNVLRGGGNK